ncbi:MAG: hypothetical protein K9G59_00035 [Caulobacter sp.]|nr:hypothetical protein [Caulobacter sp.]
MTHDDDDPPKRGRGRPPVPGRRGPKGGESSMVLMRVPTALRLALEQEAQTTGRSMAQVGARWMEQAQAGQSSVEALLGGGRVAEALRGMIAFANTVRSTIGDPEVSPVAHAALVAGWIKYIAEANLRDQLTKQEANLAIQRADVRRACQGLVDAEEASSSLLAGLEMPIVREVAHDKVSVTNEVVACLEEFATEGLQRTELSQALKIGLMNIEDACRDYFGNAADLDHALVDGLAKGRELFSALFEPLSIPRPRLAAIDGQVVIEAEQA